MLKYYSVSKSIQRVKLADGTTLGIPPRKEISIDESLISAELQSLVDRKIIRYRGRVGGTQPEVVPDVVLPEPELLTEIMPDPLQSDTSTSIQEVHGIVSDNSKTVVSDSLISEDIVVSDIKDVNEVLVEDSTDDESGHKPRTRRKRF